jgi:hypothetical protein
MLKFARSGAFFSDPSKKSAGLVENERCVIGPVRDSEQAGVPERKVHDISDKNRIICAKRDGSAQLKDILIGGGIFQKINQFVRQGTLVLLCTTKKTQQKQSERLFQNGMAKSDKLGTHLSSLKNYINS